MGYQYILLVVDSKLRLCMAPGHRTVQEGLSMVYVPNDDVENVEQQSKHVLVKKKKSKFLPMRALSRPAQWAGFLRYALDAFSVVSCRICITFLTTFPWIFLSLSFENAGGCCKAR